MLRIYLCLIIVGLVFQFCGVCTEEPKVTPQNENTDITVQADKAEPSDIDNNGASQDHTHEPHPLPEAPFPVPTEEEEEHLVPPTSTSGTVIVVGGGAGGAAAPVSVPDIEDVSSMDSTQQTVEYSGETTGTEPLTKAVPTQTSDIHRSRDGDTEKVQPSDSGPPESDRTSTDTKAGASLGDVPNTGEVKDTRVHKVVQLPAATETLNDFLQTRIFEGDKVSHQQPSSEMDTPTFDPMQATEALKSVGPGTAHLPVGVGGMAVDPQVMREAVVTTQFSVAADGESSALPEEETGEDGQKEGEEEFPTFDKWSVQYLAEQEKQKIEKEQLAVNPAASPVGQKKLRQNFAAASCGAKVVASNAEAENTNFLLNGNPDEYMLNPCKAKKWFVVELCEPLQIHKIDLGTLELFSSQPKSFRVFSSQRYPTKEWTPLGKFEMTRERTVQSFHTQLNEEFVKFVRVEMLEHHGDEHYCPLTTLRVLGIDMASEEEDEGDHEVVESEGEDSTPDASDDELEESVNLFTSAKDTVVKLMKKVLYKGDNEAEAAGEVEGEGKEGERPAADNDTVKTEEKKGDSGDAEACADKKDTTLDGPTAEVPAAGVIPPPVVPQEPEEVPIVTKLADTEQLPMDTTETPIVIKLVDEEETSSHYHCFHSPLSTYAYLMAYRPSSVSTCMIRPKQADQLTKQLPLESDQGLEPPDVQPLHTEPSKDTSRVNEVVDQIPVPRDTAQNMDKDQIPPTGESSMEKPQGSSREETRKPSDQQLPTQSKMVDKPSQQQQQIPPPPPADNVVVSSQSSLFTSADVTSTRSETLEPSSLSSQADLGQEAVSMVTPGLDIQQSQVVEHGATDLSETLFLKVAPSPTLGSEDSAGVEGDILQQAPTASEEMEDMKLSEHAHLDVDSPPGPAPPPAEAKGADSVKPESETVNGTATPGSRPSKPVDLVKVGMTSNAKRDMSLMKLNNRIVALEQNVSMTKKYLEELSRAFKLQNEEMMKLLNKTEKKLNNYMAQTEERELRQQAQIEVLEQRVANLTQVVDSMQLKMDTMGRELRDGQVLLAFLQAVLFVWLMISSYRGRSRQTLNYTDHQFLLDTMPTKPTIGTSNSGHRQRRNSDAGQTTASDQKGSSMKRQRSYMDLVASDPGKLCAITDDLNIAGMVQASKKKKKKKLKQQPLSMDSSISTTTTSCHNHTQCSSFSSSAGVLFGTGGRQESTDASQINGSFGGWLPKENENQSRIPGNSSGNWLENVYQNVGKIPCSQPICVDPGLASRQHGFLQQPVYSHHPLFGRGPDYRADPLPNGGLRVFQNHTSGWTSDVTPGRSCLSSFSVTLRDPALGTEPKKISPEFHMPPYHRKIRKLADTSTDRSSVVGLRDAKIRNARRESLNRRRSTGFVNPKAGAEFFLAENYLSENRFKFPVSPGGDTVTEQDVWAQRGTEWDVTGSGCAGLGPIDERYPPLMACPSKRFPALLPTASLESACPPATPSGPQLPILSAASSWSSMYSSCSSSQKSPPQTPPFALSDHSTAQTSFISSPPPRPPPPPPLSLAHLARSSVPPAKRDQYHHHQQQHHRQKQTPASKAQVVETGPVVSLPANSSRGNSQATSGAPIVNAQARGAMKENVNTTGTGKGNANHVRGDNHRPGNSHQTHRRQGSNPLDQLRVSKSMEKEPGRARQGSIDGPKQGGKTSTGNQPGAKMKKTPSNPSFLSRKGSGSKNRHS